ncbi:MAG: hypothetical protein GTO16_06465 [Candidatus Aminicenantes bacterium]|nr:hypothetical protein [Candidatus Aminicenantes bacterium]
MNNVKEHLCDDDPAKGHPDVRTKLKDVSYFFLGNGHIQAAVQIAPSGEGTPIGLLIMNPEHLGKKREALTFDPDSGLENTMIRIISAPTAKTTGTRALEAGWLEGYEIPVAQIIWRGGNFQVAEYFYCPNLSHPEIMREVRLRNISNLTIKARLKTGVLDKTIDEEFYLQPEGIKIVLLRYTLNSSGKHITLDLVPKGGIGRKALQYWKEKACASFGSPILDHFFTASQFQLPAVVSKFGKVDGNIWQHNRERARDQAMVAVGLTITGHYEIAYRILDRMIEEFVTKKGDITDSEKARGSDEIDLDQNGSLLFALKNYVLWTDSYEIVTKHWNKIVAAAEFPLAGAFVHSRSGLLANRKEYWGRHQTHGIVKGMELAHQLFAVLGLSAASTIASLISRKSEASHWKHKAERIMNATLDEAQYGLVDARGFIKRRGIDGVIQEIVKPLPKAQFPEGSPLSLKGEHRLNPDATSVLPIAMGIISPDSPLASLTLDSVEKLWNQAWKDGGYGRYDISSEPDSPGSWPIASLFVARSYAETGNFDKMWRTLEWLNSAPGALSGSWFEFYGQRLDPRFSQEGIAPWIWAEMLILLIHHIIGIQPDVDHLRIRPKLVPGIEKITASFPLRDRKINIEIKSGRKKKSYGFSSDGKIIQSSEKEAYISYPEKDIWVEASLP